MEETNEKEQKMYARACTEVLEILKDAPPEDINKIPKELIEALESKKDKNYKFETNSYMSFENEDISETARVMLMGIFREYIMKSQIDEQEQKVENKVDIEENSKSNAEEINNENNDEEQIALIEIKKESLYRKIINFFKKLFHVKTNKDNLESFDE